MDGLASAAIRFVARRGASETVCARAVGALQFRWGIILIHRTYRPYILLILGAALLAPLPACDRNDEAPPPIIIVTPQPVRGVIAQTSFSGYFTGIWVGIEVQVQNKGRVDITVDWTEDETWMGLEQESGDDDPVRLGRPRILSPPQI